MSTRARILSFAAFAAIATAPLTARADDKDDDESLGVFIVGVLGPEVALGIGGLVAATGTGVTLDDQPPPYGWRVASYVFGSLLLSASVPLLYFGGAIAAGTSDDPAPWLTCGIADVVLGAVDIGLAARASTLAPDVAATPLPSLTLVVDGRGELTPLVGLGGTF
jgi:hypothetical protein